MIKENLLLRMKLLLERKAQLEARLEFELLDEQLSKQRLLKPSKATKFQLRSIKGSLRMMRAKWNQGADRYLEWREIEIKYAEKREVFEQRIEKAQQEIWDLENSNAISLSPLDRVTLEGKKIAIGERIVRYRDSLHDIERAASVHEDKKPKEVEYISEADMCRLLNDDIVQTAVNNLAVEQVSYTPLENSASNQILRAVGVSEFVTLEDDAALIAQQLKEAEEAKTRKRAVV